MTPKLEYHRLRIAVDGAQCTGKTTLVQQLKDHYGSAFRYIPEAAREIAPIFGVTKAEDWPGLLKNPDRLRAFFLAEECWQTAQENSGGFVVDSSLGLIQAYKQHFGFEADKKLLATLTYDLIFYCSAENSYVADGFRFAPGRDAVDKIYLQISLRWFERQTFRLPLGPTRIQTALAAIERLQPD